MLRNMDEGGGGISDDDFDPREQLADVLAAFEAAKGRPATDAERSAISMEHCQAYLAVELMGMVAEGRMLIDVSDRGVTYNFPPKQEGK